MQGWCRYLNAMHLVTGPLLIVLGADAVGITLGTSFPMVVLVVLAGFGLAAAMLSTSVNHKPPSYHSAFAYLGFGISVMWIYMVANEIVNVLQVSY